MKETIFRVTVNNEVIHGIRHQPEPDIGKNDVLILLHGWAGYRTGPHDMLVKLARHLTGKGYDCFRFDFRGKGYSQGDRRNTSYRTMLEDLETVIQYVYETLDKPRIVLGGICSGARLALHYARNGRRPIAHVIELSSPVLRQGGVEIVLAGNEAKSTLKTYARKLFRAETWLKFTDGEVHFSSVFRNVLRPFLRLFADRRKTSRKKLPANAVKKQEVQAVQPFGQFHGRMLLVHGEKDLETKPALSQIHEMLYHYHVSADTHIVKNANHSFYSLAWENEIICVIEEWITKTLL
jgi:pimeloyl-ACP methyl ester carboxylesterase